MTAIEMLSDGYRRVLLLRDIRDLTKRPANGTMPAVPLVSWIRRVTAIALLSAALPVGSVAVACAGWSGSASERMACCQKSHDPCSSLSPDDCCAASEARQHANGTPAIVVTPPAVSAAALAPYVPARQPRVNDPRPLSEGPDTYLLDSVFRI
jgi:hypothetical protein